MTETDHLWRDKFVRGTWRLGIVGLFAGATCAGWNKAIDILMSEEGGIAMLQDEPFVRGLLMGEDTQFETSGVIGSAAIQCSFAASKINLEKVIPDQGSVEGTVFYRVRDETEDIDERAFEKCIEDRSGFKVDLVPAPVTEDKEGGPSLDWQKILASIGTQATKLYKELRLPE